MIVLGSGGHTTEMFKLIRDLDPDSLSRVYVMADSDTLSQSKINSDADIVKIPRSRSVHQSWITTPFTTIYSFFYCIKEVWWYSPDLILCNGPGTCVPICLAAFLLKMLLLGTARIVFVESFARVETLSLTGKILYYLKITDRFLVQWPQLTYIYPKVEYKGPLM
ncbi:glycosyltransferase [Globomyces pollinis-pini]|nr:glycosyltransferase [Globomyces pollinis-pini]